MKTIGVLLTREEQQEDRAAFDKALNEVITAPEVEFVEEEPYNSRLVITSADVANGGMRLKDYEGWITVGEEQFKQGNSTFTNGTLRQIIEHEIDHVLLWETLHINPHDDVRFSGRFPLDERKLIRGCQAHISAGLSCAADYVANYVPLYAPFAGTVSKGYGPQGGKWLYLTRDNGDRIEFAHLDSYRVWSGRVEAGDILATTGNTGGITTGPHLHIQIFRNGKRLDPEKYSWRIGREEAHEKALQLFEENYDPAKHFLQTKEPNDMAYPLVRAQGTKDIYRIKDGKKDLYLNSKSFIALDGRWGDIQDKPQGEVEAIPNGDVLIVVGNE